MITNAMETEEAPAGFSLPRAAVGLINTAALSGWVTGWVWDQDMSGSPFVKVHVGDRETGEVFVICWHSRDTGTLRLSSTLHQEQAGHAWADGPSVKAVIHRIREVAHQRS